MKPFRYLLVAMTLMVFVGVQGAFALTIYNNAPSFGDLSAYPGLAADITNAWDNAITQIQNEVQDINEHPKKLGGAFANAGIYANHAATQRAYQGYDLFAITVGTMFGGQLPSMDFSTYGDIGDQLKTDGDIEAGLGWQAWALQAGLNSKFLLDGLYLGLKLGVVKFDLPIGDNAAKVDYFTIGAIANYQIFKSRSLTGALVWRGLSVGSGILYQKNSTGFLYSVGEIVSGEFNTSGYSITIATDPELALLLDSHLVTIPLEVTTSVRIAWFLNLSVGIGADVNFGKSSLIARVKTDANVQGLPGGVEQQEPGEIWTNAGVKDAKPKAFAAKAMANIGIGVGPVILDIPVTYYFNNGFSLGLSVGFVW